MPRDGTPTRRRLLDAALLRFADEHLDRVSLNEILEAAGQRNASALQYHFTNRDGLIRAILAEFTPPIRERRRELLATARLVDDPRPAAEAVVLPIGEHLLGDWQQLCFVDVATQLWTDPRRRVPELAALTGDTESFAAIDLLLSRLPDIPDGVRSLRVRVSTMMVMHAVADKSRLIRTHGANSRQRGDVPMFIDALVDMYLNCMAGPIRTSAPSAG